MNRILELETKFRLKLITAEFEILCALYFNGATRSSELALKTKASVANFQIILRRLRDEGLVVHRQDDGDGRVRVYDLSREIREEIGQVFGNEEQSQSIFEVIAPYARRRIGEETSVGLM